MQENYGKNPDKPVRGCDVDDACRAVAKKRAMVKYFIHRTGHSITTDTHGSGANMDNFETNDTRPLIPMTSFSIEPIYIEGDIGMRTEIDVVISESGEVIVSVVNKKKCFHFSHQTWILMHFCNTIDSDSKEKFG